MTPQYYAQWGEDRILNAVFEGRAAGICVEVGVNDPVKFSNSYFFERLGWRTILVEANPEAWDKIAATRTGQLFRCGASDRCRTAEFIIADKALGMSTLETARLEAIAKSEGVARTVSVALRTLDDILKEAGVTQIDFVSIDVEGHEASVLGGFDVRLFKPRVILVERNERAATTVNSYLAACGYVRILTTGCNDWYARPEDQELRQRARSAYTFVDRVILWREKLRLAAIASGPPWLVSLVRRLKHSTIGRSQQLT